MFKQVTVLDVQDIENEALYDEIMEVLVPNYEPMGQNSYIKYDSRDGLDYNEQPMYPLLDLAMVEAEVSSVYILIWW